MLPTNSYMVERAMDMKTGDILQQAEERRLASKVPAERPAWFAQQARRLSQQWDRLLAALSQRPQRSEEQWPACLEAGLC